MHSKIHSNRHLCVLCLHYHLSFPKMNLSRCLLTGQHARVSPIVDRRLRPSTVPGDLEEYSRHYPTVSAQSGAFYRTEGFNHISSSRLQELNTPD